MNDERHDRQNHASARDRRLEYQARWVDLQVQRAIERGEFDGLPGTGKPIDDLGTTHDPDWWLKRLIEREQITGVLPPALSLRVEDAQLDDVLDAERSERRVRELLEDFNARVVGARRQLQGGPPVITPTRDVDAELESWRQRGAARRERAQRPPAVRRVPDPEVRRRRWWRRLVP
ncbi:DUF1992 domain-containing protein [Aeromicrobium sp.]|uniref:DnaJ family domain-containing protein n=1 Tax=Aeromicrobium sp. TaxID=1871063 RepID=UPI003C60A0B4